MFPFALAAFLILLTGCGSGQSSTNGDKQQISEFEQKFTTDSLIKVFKDAALPVGPVTTYDASTDPNELLGRPGQYVGKAKWVETRIKQSSIQGSDPKGGDVEIFDSQKSMDQRWQYLGGFSDSSLLGFYMYHSGNAIVRLEHDLTPDQAAEYEAALKSATQ